MGRGNNLNDDFSSTSWMLGYEASIKAIHSGVGLMHTKDNVGPYINHRYSLTYSYVFTLSDSSQFRLGTNLSLDRKVLDFSRYRYIDPDDLLIYGRGRFLTSNPLWELGSATIVKSCLQALPWIISISPIFTKQALFLSVPLVGGIKFFWVTKTSGGVSHSPLLTPCIIPGKPAGILQNGILRIGILRIGIIRLLIKTSCS
jgi:hypothetical protein